MVRRLSFWTDTVIVIIPRRIESELSSSGQLDWGGASRLPVPDSYYEPIDGTDTETGEIYNAQVFMSEAPVGFNENCKVEWEGEQYVVVGRPLKRRSPTGAVDHVHVKIRSVNASRTRWNQ